MAKLFRVVTLFAIGICTAVGGVQGVPSAIGLVVVRSGAAADAVAFFDPATGDLVEAFGAITSNPASEDSIAFTPDGSVAFVTGGAGIDSVQVYDLTGPLPLLIASNGLLTAPFDVDVSPDGTLAVVRSGAAPDAVAFFDSLTGGAVAVFAAATSNPGSSNSIAFAPDGTRAMVTGGAGISSVQVFDLTVSPPVLLTSHALTTAPEDMAVAPDGSVVIVRSGAGPDAVTFFDPATGDVASAMSAATSNPVQQHSIAISPSSNRAIVTGGAGIDAVKIVDLTSTPAVEIASHTVLVAPYDVDVDPAGNLAIVRAGGASLDGVTFYDLSSGALVAAFLAKTGNPTASNSIAISPDGSRAMITGGAGVDAVQVFDLTADPPVLIVSHLLTTAPDDVHISPDGLHGVVRAGAGSDAVTFFDPASGALVHSASAATSNPAGSNAVEINPDSSGVFVTGGAGIDSVQFFDLTTTPPALAAVHSLVTAPHDVNHNSPRDFHTPCVGGIDLEKATNGLDADVPPGPTIPIGAPVIWTYRITNIGCSTLTDIAVDDDILGPIACIEGAIPDLAPGESFQCTAVGVGTVIGQYANVATATGLPLSGFPVSDSDPSHYFGIEVGLQADFGDAPDDTVDPTIEAYPGVPGKFPSLLNTANTAVPGNVGVHHGFVIEEWLAAPGMVLPTTTTEGDALLVDADRDDALVLIACEPDAGGFLCSLQIRSVHVSPFAPVGPRFLNALADLNRGGSWQAAEHLIADAQVAVAPGGTSGILSSPPFVLAATGSSVWVRVTLTRLPLGAVGWDGSIPAPAMSLFGETEDHLVTPAVRALVEIPAISRWGLVLLSLLLALAAMLLIRRL